MRMCDPGRGAASWLLHGPFVRAYGLTTRAGGLPAPPARRAAQLTLWSVPRNGHNAARLHPLRKRADLCSWICICQIRPPDRIERTGGHCKRSVERVRPPVPANDVAVLRSGNGADDRATLVRAPPPNESESELWRWGRDVRSAGYNRYGLSGSSEPPPKC
jgi:hypothetical protein